MVENDPTLPPVPGRPETAGEIDPHVCQVDERDLVAVAFEERDRGDTGRDRGDELTELLTRPN